jgi:hypothetical protein
MTRGRKATYQTAAEKQRAYRERRAAGKTTNEARAKASVTRMTGGTANIVTKPAPALPVASDAAQHPSTPQNPQPGAEVRHETGAVCSHCEAAGLLVRVLARIDGRRVKAQVLQPGATHLTPGWAYPFRADLLAEVTV